MSNHRCQAIARKMKNSANIMSQMHKDGANLGEIANRLNVSRPTVSRHMEKLGLRERGAKPNAKNQLDPHKEDITLMISKNIRIKDIAKKYGVTAASISYAAKKWGLKIRRQSKVDRALAYKMYMDCRSYQSIADCFGVTATFARASVLKHIDENHLPERDKIKLTDKLEEDKELILALLNDGVSSQDVAEKFEVSRSTLQTKITQWNYDFSNHGINTPSISLNDLKHGGWTEVEEETVLTIGRIPRFIIKPI